MVILILHMQIKLYPVINSYCFSGKKQTSAYKFISYFSGAQIQPAKTHCPALCMTQTSLYSDNSGPWLASLHIYFSTVTSTGGVTLPKTTGTNVGGHPSVHSREGCLHGIVPGPLGGHTRDLHGEGIADLSCQHPLLNRVPLQFSCSPFDARWKYFDAPASCLFWPSEVGMCSADIKHYH